MCVHECVREVSGLTEREPRGAGEPQNRDRLENEARTAGALAAHRRFRPNYGAGHAAAD